MRNSDSLNQIPDDMKNDFLDMGEKNIEKLKKLKMMISNTFPVSIFKNNWLVVLNPFNAYSPKMTKHTTQILQQLFKVFLTILGHYSLNT